MTFPLVIEKKSILLYLEKRQIAWKDVVCNTIQLSKKPKHIIKTMKSLRTLLSATLMAGFALTTVAQNTTLPSSKAETDAKRLT